MVCLAEPSSPRRSDAMSSSESPTRSDAMSSSESPTSCHRQKVPRHVIVRKSHAMSWSESPTPCHRQKVPRHVIVRKSHAMSSSESPTPCHRQKVPRDLTPCHRQKVTAVWNDLISSSSGTNSSIWPHNMGRNMSSLTLQYITVMLTELEPIL